MKAQLQRVDPRGLFASGCLRVDGVWHLWRRVDGQPVDKGPCEHDHSDLDEPDCCCGGKSCHG